MQFLKPAPYKYFERGQVYYADTCTPLRNAWHNNRIKVEAWARSNYPASLALPDNVLTGLSSIGYWDAKSAQDWGLDWHRNEGIEITFLETGNIAFSTKGNEYELAAGDLTITRPWQEHKLGNPTIGLGRLYWIILDVNVRYPHQEWEWPEWLMLTRSDITELTRMFRQNEQLVWKTNGDIQKCFQRIGQLVASEDVKSNESWVIILINELLLYLLKFFRQGKVSFDESLIAPVRTVQLFIDQLENNFAEPWTLERMADQCGIGVTRFVHYFKQVKNQPPMSYLISLRTEAAARYLKKNPEMPIQEIAYLCGFSNGQYFSTVFKHKYGQSPHLYRKQYLNT